MQVYCQLMFWSAMRNCLDRRHCLILAQHFCTIPRNPFRRKSVTCDLCGLCYSWEIELGNRILGGRLLPNISLQVVIPEVQMGSACVKTKIGRVKPRSVRMDVGGRNEAARRRRSIALEKQRTFSTVENQINQVKHSKNKEKNAKCEELGENGVITEEHAGEIVNVEGNMDVMNLNTPSDEFS